MARYKNISQRARQYAHGKLPGYSDFGRYHLLASQGFADGYRFAMKEIRELLEENKPWGERSVSATLTTFANDTERLK